MMLPSMVPGPMSPGTPYLMLQRALKKVQAYFRLFLFNKMIFTIKISKEKKIAKFFFKVKNP